MADFLYLPSFRWSELHVSTGRLGGADLQVPLDPGDLTDIQVQILCSRMARAFAVVDIALEQDELGARFRFQDLGVAPDDGDGLRAFRQDATAILEGVHQDALAGWSAGDEIAAGFRLSQDEGRAGP